MLDLVQIEPRDRDLIGRIDAASAESIRRSGSWIACRPGCTQCCFGPFTITELDAMRLRRGLKQLAVVDLPRAERVRDRVAGYLKIVAGAPEDEDHLPMGMEDVTCPALDPESGSCDLYAARPVTCRTFGPAVLTGDGNVAVCELCYVGASDEEIARCAVDIDPDCSESGLLEEMGLESMTIVARALAGGAITAQS